jgi:aminoglycoside/choline kinase family phosphotransferase
VPAPDKWREGCEWATTEVGEVRRIEPLAGDLSPRSYARLRVARGSFVLSLYPGEALPTCARFLATTRLLEAAAVRVPRIVAADAERGLVLLEDLGPTTLYDARVDDWSEVAAVYQRGADVLTRIGGIDRLRCDELSPRLDAVLQRRELDQTRRLFFDPWLPGDAALGADDLSFLDSVCDQLEARGLVPCHRDFMARNLVPLPDDLAVLDHQDLRLGPKAYDLASLLNDSLFPPAELERRIFEHWSRTNDADWLDYRLAVVQRSFKAVGTYAFFASRGQTRHVPLIRPTLERALAAMAELPAGGSLSRAWRPRLLAGAEALSATVIGAERAR